MYARAILFYLNLHVCFDNICTKQLEIFTSDKASVKQQKAVKKCLQLTLYKADCNNCYKLPQ